MHDYTKDAYVLTSQEESIGIATPKGDPIIAYRIYEIFNNILIDYNVALKLYYEYKSCPQYIPSSLLFIAIDQYSCKNNKLYII